ncbi:MAG: glycerophosphodiester phosphodiesterase family protein [Candidatus Cryptobacteroides sp.]
MQTCIAVLAAILISGCASQNELPVNPSVSAPSRVMLKETVNVYLKGVNSGTAFTVDFGDGTVIDAVAPSPATHAYTEGSDYTLTVSSSVLDENYVSKLRCYPLEALSSAQKNFRDSSYKKVWVMTHRAHTTDPTIPENSISAVKASIAAGAEAVECDTHRTKDGKIVICHDQSINRTTTGTGDITALTLAEIRSYKLLDRNGNPTNEVMPTLEEFLEACRGKIYVDLDYSPRTASTAEVMDVVVRMGMLEQVWFYCNSVEKCKEVLAIAPNAHPYCWATQYSPLTNLDGNYFVQYCYATDGTSTSIGSAIRDGMLCSVCFLSVLDGQIPEYQINSTQLDDLLGIYPDVKMIMTDAPAELISALDSRGRR